MKVRIFLFQRKFNVFLPSVEKLKYVLKKKNAFEQEDLNLGKREILHISYHKNLG